MHIISDHESFFQITFEGTLDPKQMLTACHELLTRDDYAARNDIWLFNVPRFDFPFEKMGEIAQVVKSLYPEQASRNKTAFVAAAPLINSILSGFADSDHDLPFEVRVFETITAAKLWLNE